MNTIKYFSDTANGSIEVFYPHAMKNAEYAAKFPGVKGRRYDGFSMMVGNTGNQILPITRAIEYKRFASKHVCNAKCMGGKVNGTCECSCGGKNHGFGNFAAYKEAA